MVRWREVSLSLTLCLLVIAAWFSPARAEVRISETTKAKNKIVILENSYWKLRFEPERGGICTGLFYKPLQKEFTDSRYGLFEDHLSEQPYKGDWYQKPYAYSIRQKAGQVSIKLWRAGTSLKFVTITKTITLSENSPVIKVDYEFHNQVEAMAPVTISPRYHNILFLPEDSTYFFPTSKGIRKMDYIHNSAKAQPQYWEYDPTGAWSGFVGNKSRAGLVCLFTYPTIRALYDWFGNVKYPAATIEWFSNPITIDAGKSFRNTWYILPFEGLSEIQEATAEIVCGLKAPINPRAGQSMDISFKAFSEFEGLAQVTYQVRRLPEARYRVLKKITWHLKTAELSRDTFSFQPKAEGTYVVEAIVNIKGRKIAKAEIPVVVGKPSAAYKMLPWRKRIVLSKEKRYFPLVLKPDYVTPHWKWAKPYYQGKIKVLFLMAALAQREIIELYQRMDLDYTNATLLRRANRYSLGWYPPSVWNKISGSQIQKEGYKEVEKLLEKKYDAIVISASRSSNNWYPAIEWGKFTEASRKKILEKVKSGTGLVVIQPQAMKLTGELEQVYKKARISNERDYLVQGIPFKILPALRTSGATHAGGRSPINFQDIKIADLGKGRIVFLDYDTWSLTPDAELKQTAFPYWEYYYGLLIKTLLYVSEKEGPAAIIDIKKPAIPLTTANVNISSFQVALSGIPSEDNISLSVRVIGENGEEEAEFTKQISGEGTVKTSLTLPPLKAGKHLVTFTLKIGEKTADFWTSVVRVTTPIQANIILKSDKLVKGEPLQGLVRLENIKSLSANARVEISLRDIYERLIYQESFPITQEKTEYPFKTALSNRLTRIYDLKAEVKEGKRNIVAIHKEIVCPEVGNSFDDLYGVMWTGIGEPEYLAYYEYLRLKEMGVGAMDSWDRYFPITSYLMAKANLPISGHGNLYRITSTAKDLITMRTSHIRTKNGKYQSLSDPEHQDRVLKIVENNIRNTLRYGSAFFILADEPSHYWYDNPVDASWDKFSQAGFRNWLKGIYGTLRNLNKEWGTSFKSWDEVKPAWEDRMKGETADFAAWADFRTYMDKVYYDINKRLRNLKDKLAPRARWGISGLEGNKTPIFSGNRWEKMKDIFNLYALYSTGELQQAFNPEAITGWWNGYFRSEPVFQYIGWKSILTGARFLPFWHSPIFLLPDFRISPYYGLPLKNMISEMNSGIGTLFFYSKRKTSPIAVYYSHSSAQALYILKYLYDSDTKQIFFQNKEDYKSIIKDLGFQPTFLYAKELEEGRLEKSNIKVLILPLSIALSDREIAAIKSFVKGGGMVISDCLTGKMDEHLKRRDHFPLDEVFGITGSPSLKMVMEENRGTVTVDGKSDGLSLKFAGPALELTTGKAAGKVNFEPLHFGRLVFDSQTGKESNPLLITNSYGKGKAVYLNFLLRYGSRKENSRKLLRDIFAELLGEAGLRSPLRITEIATSEPISCEVNEFVNGDMHIFGLMRFWMQIDNASAAEKAGFTMNDLLKDRVKAKVTFPKVAYTYDLREHKYLGETSNIKAELAPGVARVFVQLPYRIQRVKLKLSRERLSAGSSLDYTLTLQTSQKPGAGKFVVKMDVFTPDGKVSVPYSRRIVFSGNTYQGGIPLALNDVKGTWKVRVTEAISGLKNEKKFIVTGP